MAGVGFALRRLAERGDLLGVVQAYAHSAAASTGPWLYTIVCLATLTVYSLPVVGSEGVTLFRAIVTYNFAFSLVFSGGLVRVITRCLADQIYERRADQAPGMIIGGMFVLCLIQAPIAVPYRGFELRQTPPNSTGFTLLQMLRIVGRFDLAALGWNSPALIHLLVEAKKRAFLDREAHGGDPRGGAIPLDRLLSAEHAAAHAAAIDPRRAAHLPVRPEAGGGGDTTYFCVVDAAGNRVSAIQSLNSAFGSGVIAEGTGVLLNNRMAYWHLEPGHANALRPGLRVRHTMNAPLLLKDGRPWCVLGTPGADHQVQVNLQAIVAMVDFGLDPQQALEAPRWTSSQPGQEANYPHGGAELLTLEAGFGAGTAAALEELGHRVRLVGDLEGPCSLEAIRLLGNGVRMAASDPRRDGWAGAH